MTTRTGLLHLLAESRASCFHSKRDKERVRPNLECRGFGDAFLGLRRINFSWLVLGSWDQGSISYPVLKLFSFQFVSVPPDS